VLTVIITKRVPNVPNKIYIILYKIGFAVVQYNIYLNLSLICWYDHVIISIIYKKNYSHIRMGVFYTNFVLFSIK